MVALETPVAPGSTTYPDELPDHAFEKIGSLLQAETGILLDPSKQRLVYGRLLPELKRLKLRSFEAYCAHLERSDATRDKQTMVSLLTTNLTYFFRESHHFDLLRNEALPPLIAKARQGASIRIWSAGCSEGMEPYSIAMSALDLAPDLLSLNFKILATDINDSVLQTATAGRYPVRTLEKVPNAFREKFFSIGSEGRTASVKGEARSLITFRRFNLKHEIPERQRFDIIFCRNVVIYLDDPTRAAIWNRFAKILPPGGWLMIGHSERLTPEVSSGFEQVGLTAFRRTEQAFT